MVERLGQRTAQHPEHRPGQGGEIPGQPQHPVNEGLQAGRLAPDVGLRDLRHQQDGEAAQQAKRKRQQGQRHPFQAAILGHGGVASALSPQCKGKAGGHQHVLRRVQGAGKAPPALHRPQDVPEPSGRVTGAPGLFPGKAAPGLPVVEQEHHTGRDCLAQGRGRQHRGALSAVIPAP